MLQGLRMKVIRAAILPAGPAEIIVTTERRKLRASCLFDRKKSQSLPASYGSVDSSLSGQLADRHFDVLNFNKKTVCPSASSWTQGCRWLTKIIKTWIHGSWNKLSRWIYVDIIHLSIGISTLATLCKRFICNFHEEAAWSVNYQLALWVTDSLVLWTLWVFASGL